MVPFRYGIFPSVIKLRLVMKSPIEELHTATKMSHMVQAGFRINILSSINSPKVTISGSDETTNINPITPIVCCILLSSKGENLGYVLEVVCVKKIHAGLLSVVLKSFSHGGLQRWLCSVIMQESVKTMVVDILEIRIISISKLLIAAP